MSRAWSKYVTTSVGVRDRERIGHAEYAMSFATKSALYVHEEVGWG